MTGSAASLSSCSFCSDNEFYKSQYTTPSPTRLNCRVESRRRCVLNSQLAHHDCRRVRSRRRHDATPRLRCWQICSDSSRLSPTSFRKFRTDRRRDSTVEWHRRCVLRLNSRQAWFCEPVRVLFARRRWQRRHKRGSDDSSQHGPRTSLPQGQGQVVVHDRTDCGCVYRLLDTVPGQCTASVSYLIS